MKYYLLRMWRYVPTWLQRIIEWLLLNKFLVGAVAIIFNEKQQILLFHHTYRKKYPWGLPGGWLNFGEDPSAAIVREIKEEAGFSVEVKELLFVGRSKKHAHLTIVFLCVNLKGNFQKSDEVSEFSYFDIDQIPQFIDENQREYIPELLAQIIENNEGRFT